MLADRPVLYPIQVWLLLKLMLVQQDICPFTWGKLQPHLWGCFDLHREICGADLSTWIRFAQPVDRG